MEATKAVRSAHASHSPSAHNPKGATAVFSGASLVTAHDTPAFIPAPLDKIPGRSHSMSDLVVLSLPVRGGWTFVEFSARQVIEAALKFVVGHKASMELISADTFDRLTITRSMSSEFLMALAKKLGIESPGHSAGSSESQGTYICVELTGPAIKERARDTQHRFNSTHYRALTSATGSRVSIPITQDLLAGHRGEGLVTIPIPAQLVVDAIGSKGDARGANEADALLRDLSLTGPRPQSGNRAERK